jgi:hypothetical protein
MHGHSVDVADKHYDKGDEEAMRNAALAFDSLLTENNGELIQ